VILRPFFALVLAGAGALVVSPSSASSPKTPTISDVTVTAAAKGHDSAVVLKIVNSTSQPISLLSVTSPSAGGDMIFFDTNMCQGNHAMTVLSNIYISSGFTQKLGYKFQGAMLSALNQELTVGQKVPLVVTWSNFNTLHHSTVEAAVVAPPHHIKFLMGNMSM
jgi:copper(I)-binding protein